MSESDIIKLLEIDISVLNNWRQSDGVVPFEKWKKFLSEIGPERIEQNGRAEPGWPEDIWEK